jgi:EAL domain-containing protein (putative c-di-GMP-specific phosphodiesterase class I)
VFAQACRQARDWHDQGHRGIPIAVNLSAREFNQPALLESIRQQMANLGIGPGQLSIELTESVIMSDADQAIETLENLRAMGLDVAVDDFGTGYSSMNYLRQLPATKLKLDRSFISELGASPKNDAIVRAMVGLAHGLGMRVVAEGVEERDQLLRLGELGCDEYQGYLFSRPQPAAAIPELLARPAKALTDLDIAWWLVAT